MLSSWSCFYARSASSKTLDYINKRKVNLNFLKNKQKLFNYFRIVPEEFPQRAFPVLEIESFWNKFWYLLE